MGKTDVGLERTPDGRKLVVARRIDASPTAAWDLLTDTRRWSDWGPSVRAVDCEPTYIEEGTTGRVRIPGGVWLPFEITACREYRWTWRVAKVPATGHFVESDGGGCRVGFELPVVGAGYAPVCARALGRIETLLAGDGSNS